METGIYAKLIDFEPNPLDKLYFVANNTQLAEWFLNSIGDVLDISTGKILNFAKRTDIEEPDRISLIAEELATCQNKIVDIVDNNVQNYDIVLPATVWSEEKNKITCHFYKIDEKRYLN